MNERGIEPRFREVWERSFDAMRLVDEEGILLQVNNAYCRLVGKSRKELEGASFATVYFEEEREEAVRLLREGIRRRTVQPKLETEILLWNGQRIWSELSNSLLEIPGESPQLLTIFRDIAERKRAEKIRHAVYRISESASSGCSLDELFRSIHSIINELMPAKNLYVAIQDAGTGIISFPYFVDEYDDVPAPRLPGRGLTEHVLRTGEPMLASPEKFDELARAGEVKSVGQPSIDWLGVPLRLGGKTLGVLVVQTYSEGVRYTVEHRDILLFVSAQVAMGIERKRAEERTARSERRFRAVFENSIDGICIMQADHIIECNQRIEEIFGYDRAAITMRTPVDLSPPLQPDGRSSRDAAKERIMAALGGRPQVFEWKHIRRNGELFDAEISLNAVEIDGEEQLQAIVRDITSRKQVEDTLRKYEFIANATNDLMTLVSRDYIFEAANDAYCTAHTKRREEIVGRTMGAVWGQKVFTEKIRENLEKCFGGSEVHYQADFEFPVGGIRSYDVAYYPYRKENAGITHAVVVSHDITERLRAEDQIRSSLREKEILLREVHHRVKNNLQVISSLLNLQSTYIRDQQHLEVFRESQNRIRTMALIHEKLYRSKDFSRVDFAEYVQGVTTFLFRSYSHNNGTIALRIDVHDVSLGVDMAIPCGLIINELVSNSLKHAFPFEKKGDILIRLTANTEDIELEVRDNGVGFPPEVDFRNTETLGLQLVLTLAEQIGASIRKNDMPGTSFVLKFKQT